MLKKRIFVGAIISITQIALFYTLYHFIGVFDGLFGVNFDRTVFESIFLDWFIDDYVLIFALLIILQNLIIAITWRRKWTLGLRVITTVLHVLFWLDNMETVYYESIILGIGGVVLIWIGPVFETFLLRSLKIEHPYRERNYYEDLN